jgi:hypothetical protein
MPSAEYNALPVPEVTVFLAWERYSEVDGSKTIAETGSVTTVGKLFLDKVGDQPTYGSSNVNMGRDKYLLLIPPEANIPFNSDIDFKVTANSRKYEFVRIHKAFSHYTIECMVIV